MSGPTPEEIKASSRHLRGALATELTDHENAFSHESEILLKFHGIYQQDDRDVRRERMQKKLPLDYICMVRAAIPGGVLTADQYLVMDSLADKVADGTLRITTRQGLQYHFTRKEGLRPLISTLNEHLVSTLAACGDVVRNVMCCPAPFHSNAREQIHTDTRALAEQFRPQTGAYWELWVDGEKAASASPPSADVEPIYGDTYLPRKFKIGVAFPGDNCIDAYTQDLAAVAVTDDSGEIRAYTILVGGGFGVSHADDTTYPRLGTPLATIAPEQLGAVAEAVVIVQRDNGERGDRKHARLKYLIDRWGADNFRVAVEKQLGAPLPDPEPITWTAAQDHLGWNEQGDGNWFLGVRVESGRINGATRVAIREVVERFKPGLRFTPNQDILLTDIRDDDRAAIDAILTEHNVVRAGDLSLVVRHALACPALPTCGLALTEAERVLPDIVTELHDTMTELGIGEEPLTFRMTGCPNGCARPYSAEIGLVGRGKKSYDVMLGGSELGTRLTQTFKKNVQRTEVIATLKPLLSQFADDRKPGERFGDFCDRIGIDALAEAE